MTNEQLYPAVGIPLLVNVALWLAVSARIGSVETGLNKRIDDTNKRIEDMRDLLRAEFHAAAAGTSARLDRIDSRLEALEAERRIIR